jgi:hypothetical protein
MLAIVYSIGDIGLYTWVCWDVLECWQGNGEIVGKDPSSNSYISLYFISFHTRTPSISYIEGDIFIS